ncbi:hypothetical protein COU60_01660 [Candidatus Pacearchaeota archaeon CG10_big_fil_rev_8_21_14_0_10_34_76]|nr:MAG: hypothetical protein COU60_01660 [Candidatus Pacearchaeota archaeon CG10_big_fil_rev_8_21_14_0_10_34_76]
MEKIILLGGSPTAGKSYTARKIAESLKMPWISTDTVREQMREIVRREDYPSLFLHANADSKMASEFLNHNSAKEIVDHVNRESEDVWKGVSAIINTDYVWKNYIIEGVAVLPKFVNKLKTNKEVRAIFLIDENIDRVRQTIFTRGLWDDADKYPNEIKEKEVEWVMEFNEFIKREARKYGFPVVSVGNRKDYLARIKKLAS